MRTVPRDKMAKIAFYEAHIEAWLAHSAEIGLDHDEVEDLAALIAAARADKIAQATAEGARISATGVSDQSVDAMHTLGATMITKIKAHAQATNDPNVFNRANVPARKVAAPFPPPSRARAITTHLNIDGSITLRWKARQPRGATGTIYQVLRRVVGAHGDFVHLGTAGHDKAFTDHTIPQGTGSLIYRIVPVRSGLFGDATETNVNFGVKAQGSRAA
jgi:hypothetical protein